MKSFAQIFREERHYCAHLFRILLEKKETDPLNSGLFKILKRINVSEELTNENIQNAEVYYEAAAFRDIYYGATDKTEFLESLYDELLQLMADKYDFRRTPPPRPNELISGKENTHPRLLAGMAEEKKLASSAMSFYREFSALFSAKPDLLIVLPKTSLWIEAKFWESFEIEQLERTKRIASLSETSLCQEYFNRREGKVVLLGSQRRHKRAQNLPEAFLSWEACSEIADELYPPHDNTRDALKSMLAMK